MKIGVLTSSRADFGIYYPLLKKLWEDKFFDIEIIAFGTHLKEAFAYTLDEIYRLGFEVKHQIVTRTDNDSAFDISNSIGETTQLFAAFWQTNTFDLVLALGDRYEMFAAVLAASPYNIKFAHIHAGETTLGAIDNAYRHSISLMSKYLFVSTAEYRKRAIEINKDSKNVFLVGALSVDNLVNEKLFSKSEFLKKFKIDLNKPTLLTTFHPETVSLHKNETYINELLAAFEVLKKEYQIVITMPNSDTMGNMIRKKINEFGENKKEVYLVENFGFRGYLSCMKHCSILLGNTSSGFAEAAFFPKWVINLGDRQKGRIITDNIINTEIKKDKILKAVKFTEVSTLPKDTNIYGDGFTSDKIISILKTLKK